MSQVNVIDSILITEERDTSKILAEWSALDPNITVHGNLQAAQAVKLFLNWSDQNGTITLQQGDYFTFIIPDIFNQDRVKDVTDAEIKSPLGEVVATYSIYDNNNKNELKMTFTDYVETHTNISGNIWLLLFVGRVESSEKKTIVFEINGELAPSGEVTINPEPPYTRYPDEEKYGKSVLVDIYNGYYIFNWTVRFNMDEDTVNGFHTLEDFSFEDVIPEDSPHVFLTEEIRQELGFSQDKFPLRVGEYKGADSYPPENRYPLFSYQYNSTGDNYWTNSNHYDYLVNGYTTVGIDGTDGLNVSDVVLTEKLLSAKLGKLTRPTTLQYCTMATIKIAESALGDSEVVKLFKNTFKSSHIEDLKSSLDKYIFGSGGEGQGITGDYSLTFSKVDEKGDVLPGVMFSLYLSESLDFADRFVYSGDDGVVTFLSLPVGTYYLKETGTPQGYILNDTVYKVIIKSEGFEIYYGDNFENKLSDHDNKIINRLEHEVLPVSVTLEGTKILTGKTLESDMFNFVVKNIEGTTVAIGTNAVNGKITFSEIKFISPEVYTFTVEEVTGTYSGIVYDNSQHMVTVTVTDDGSGKLTAETTYRNEGVVFNNSYAAESVSVTLKGTKNLTNKTLENGMFNFVVKDSKRVIVATGTNTANGEIIFDKIEFDTPGVYTFTLEEVRSSYSGITYDDSQYTVTVRVIDDGNDVLTAEVDYQEGGVVFNNRYASPVKPCRCFAKSTKCRKSIKGQKIWVDNDNEGKTRPSYVKITLLRDGEVYKSLDVDSNGDGTFVFCCIPIGKNPRHKYNYQIDELDIPDGYTKTIEGYNVINTFAP